MHRPLWVYYLILRLHLTASSISPSNIKGIGRLPPPSVFPRAATAKWVLSRASCGRHVFGRRWATRDMVYDVAWQCEHSVSTRCWRKCIAHFESLSMSKLQNLRVFLCIFHKSRRLTDALLCSLLQAGMLKGQSQHVFRTCCCVVMACMRLTVASSANMFDATYLVVS